MAMMAGLLSPMGTKTPKPIDGKKPEKRPLKGCKEYYFNSGGITTNDEYVFKCFAINDKNAIRKFNNWKANGMVS